MFTFLPSLLVFFGIGKAFTCLLKSKSKKGGFTLGLSIGGERGSELRRQQKSVVFFTFSFQTKAVQCTVYV
jgi:hypothetical protein